MREEERDGVYTFQEFFICSPEEYSGFVYVWDVAGLYIAIVFGILLNIGAFFFYYKVFWAPKAQDGKDKEKNKKKNKKPRHHEEEPADHQTDEADLEAGRNELPLQRVHSN